MIWCDGLFELVLGLLLATATLTSLDGALPLSPVLIVGFGIVLVPVGIGLIPFARSATRPAALVLAAANAGGAVLLGAWLVWGWPTFNPVGQTLVAITAVLLGLLAVLEFDLAIAARGGPLAKLGTDANINARERASSTRVT